MTNNDGINGTQPPMTNSTCSSNLLINEMPLKTKLDTIPVNASLMKHVFYSFKGLSPTARWYILVLVGMVICLLLVVSSFSGNGIATVKMFDELNTAFATGHRKILQIGKDMEKAMLMMYDPESTKLQENIFEESLRAVKSFLSLPFLTYLGIVFAVLVSVTSWLFLHSYRQKQRSPPIASSPRIPLQSKDNSPQVHETYGMSNPSKTSTRPFPIKVDEYRKQETLDPQQNPTTKFVIQAKIKKPVKVQCRICQKEARPYDLLQPCSCEGYIHKSCFKSEFKIVKSDNCPVCKTVYPVKLTLHWHIL